MKSHGDPSPLFAAKLSPPRLRAPSVRADQLARIAAAGDVSLLLVRAPAGYGKTTVVAAAAAELSWRCVWYRLDALDADPNAFLCALARALAARLPGLDEGLPGPAAEPGTRHLAVETAAKLAAELERVAGELFLVLDDYEAVAGEAAFNEALAALLSYLPPAVHVLLLSRVRPAFPTARLALDGRLAELTHDDLRFDREQVATVVERRGGVRPTDAAAGALLRLTEGWAAGVLLTGTASHGLAQSLDAALSSGDLEREVFPYLHEEVYARQAASVRAFLKDTSCLEAMTPALAAAVTGARDAGSLLEQLEADEVFAFAGPAAGGYRYHPLFRSFLQERLVLEAGQDALIALQLRTAGALADHGLAAQAVGPYLAAGETEATIALLRERDQDLLEECSEALVSQWAEALEKEGTAPAWASVLEGHHLRRVGRMDEALEQLGAATVSMDAADTGGRYLAHRELASCCYYAGRDVQAVLNLREALALAGDDGRRAACYQTLAFVLSSACRWQELDETLAAFAATGVASEGLTAKVAALECVSALKQGDVRRALAAGERCLPDIRASVTRQSLAGYLNLLANVNCFAARYGRAEQLLEEAEELCVAHHLTKGRADLEVTRGMLLAREGRLDDVLAVFDAALDAPLLRSNEPMQVELHLRRGATLRRAGRLGLATQAGGRALDLATQIGAVYDELEAGLDLAFSEGLLGAGGHAAQRIQRLRDEAAAAQLGFQVAKASFFLSVLALRAGNEAGAELGLACAQLLRLGHLDFVGHELVANQEAAAWLQSADLSDEALEELLRLAALQAGGPALLASLAGHSDQVGSRVLGMVRGDLPARHATLLLEALRRHPSKTVRDRARRLDLGDNAGATRLFPEITPREEEILALLAEGYSNEQVARRLVLSVGTVKTHVHRILSKTGSRGRLAAAVFYRQRSEAATGEGKGPSQDRDATGGS